MAYYQYQAVTAPVGINDPTPQHPVFCQVSGTRQSAPLRRAILQRESVVLGEFLEEPPGIEQWGIVDDRRRARVWPHREQFTLVTVIAAPAIAGVDQWGWRQLKQRAPRYPTREQHAQTIISGFEATTIDQWGDVEQRRTYRTFPQRDDSVTPLQPEVGTSVDQWQQLDQRRVYPRPPQAPDIVLLPLFIPDGSSLEQWGWQDSQKFRPKPQQRSDSPFPVPDVQAAVLSIDWYPYPTQKVVARPPRRSGTAGPIAVAPATPEGEWYGQTPRHVAGRTPRRDNAAVPILLIPPEGTPLPWLPLERWGRRGARWQPQPARHGWSFPEGFTLPLVVGPDGFTGGVSTVTLTAVNGGSLIEVSGLVLAGSRVRGLSSTILATFGTSGGLTGLLLGDPVLEDRWGKQSVLTENAITNQRDAHSDSEPIAGVGGYVLQIAVEGGVMDSTGQILLTLFWERLAADVP